MVCICVYGNSRKYNNTSTSYKYNFNSSVEQINQQKINKPLINATAEDALNFIANYDGTMINLQDIQNTVKDAYENYGLSKEYYDTFNASFNTYLLINAQDINILEE